MSLLLLLGTMGVAAFGWRLERSLLAPLPLFAATWSVAGALVLILYGSLAVAERAFLYIAFGAFVFMCGALLANKGRRAPRASRPFNAGAALAWKSYYVLVLFSLGAPIFLFLSAEPSTLNVLDLGAHYSAARYIHGYTASLDVRLSITAGYAAAIISGYLTAVTARDSRGLSQFLWVVPLALVALILAARAGVLIAGLLWLVSYSIARRVSSRPILPFSFRHLLTGGLIVGSVVVGGFLGIQVIRFGGEVADPFPVALRSIRPYFAGEILALDRWLSLGARSPVPSTVTFAGLSEALGGAERVPGIYSEAVSLPFDQQTNVYTAFRPLIEDLSLSGSLVILLVAGFVGTVSWRRLQTGRLLPWVAVLIINGWIVWSPITSMWAYNSTIVAALIGAVVCWHDWRASLLSGLKRRPLLIRRAQQTRA